MNYKRKTLRLIELGALALVGDDCTSHPHTAVVNGAGPKTVSLFGFLFLRTIFTIQATYIDFAAIRLPVAYQGSGTPAS
jgi:hypothetical protein